MTKDKAVIAQSLLNKFKQAGADDVIININNDLSTQIKFANSKIATTQTWNTMKADIFIALNKRLVASTIKDFSDSAVLDAVSGMIKFAQTSEPNNDYEGIAKGPFSYNEITDTYDPKLAQLNEKIADLTQGAIIAAERNGSRRSAGVMETSVFDSYQLTSNNVESKERGTKAYFSLRAFQEKYESGHCVTNSRILSKFSPDATAVNAAQIADDAKNPQPGMPGTYDVLFEPLPFSNLITQIGESSSIFNVESHLSCLAGKIGQKIASENVTLHDDGTLPNGYNSHKFDDEGVPTQKNTIIENGTLKTFLHNTSTAKRHNTISTANAGLISPSPFNIVFDNGKVNKEEIITEMKKGLIVTNVWYTRFQNYSTGDFSTIPRDGMFLVENGKIQNSVKELRISENLLNILRNVYMVGKNQQQVFGWEVDTPVTTPPVLVKDVHLTKSVA